MKAIRWLLKLMMTLPLILAVWLAKWFVVFLHHCSAWMQQLCTGAARRKFLIGLTHAAAAEGSKGYDGLTF